MIPESLGKYQMLRLLGRGGMAEVHEARDPLLERRVAIKTIHPHLAQDSDFGARFRREAKLVASLRHPNIVQLYDFDMVDGRPMMVIEYLGGGTLGERLARLRSRGARMPIPEIAALLRPLADALDCAHARNAVHRDIKPANILFTAAGEPVRTDFGITKMVDESSYLSHAGAVIGTPAYMSPEQASGRPVDARSDIYALGVVLFELATNRVPFEGEAATDVLIQHLTREPPAPREFNPALPAAIERAILRALAKEPSERYASAGELARAFVEAAGAAGPETSIVEPIDFDASTVLESAESAPTGESADVSGTREFPPEKDAAAEPAGAESTIEHLSAQEKPAACGRRRAVPSLCWGVQFRASGAGVGCAGRSRLRWCA